MTDIRVRWIIEEAADVFGVSVLDLTSPRRARPIARARQAVMWVAKQMTKHSYPEIGRQMGGRDHTTILHGARTIDRLIDERHPITDQIRTLVTRTRIRADNEERGLAAMRKPFADEGEAMRRLWT